MTRSRWRRSTPARAALTSAEIDRVRAVLYLSGLRDTDLADAAQEVQLRVLERAPDELQFPGAWACAVAANLAKDWHRRNSRARFVQESLARVPDADVTDPDLALKAAVAAGLARLDPDLRTVLVLRFYADLSVREIAEQLGVAEGTVKSRLHRAASAMRELLPRESVM
jgi:RNA polymerase sigma-70 factor (ECF subfamily)